MPTSVYADADADADAKNIVFNGEISTYNIMVQILPNTPVVGPVQFRIYPTHLNSDDPVEKAIITIIVNSNKESFMSRAVNSPNNPDIYFANLTLYQPGQWNVEVEISTIPDRKHSIFFPITITGSNVHSETFIPTSYAGIFFIFIFLTIVTCVIILSFKYRKKPSY
jgi:hypothetical protein